ncbi:hypothetical protein ACKI17_49050, partial [Streptomyces niveiscabiei]
MLTNFDRLTSGAQTRRVAEGVPYATGERRKLDVWAPRRTSDKPLPVVVFFYGGGWSEGARGDYGF